jgi:hypothetical protein
MNEQQQPRPTPELKKDFKRAHDNAPAPTPPAPKREPFTKAELEALEKQRKNSAPQPALTPPGVRPTLSRQEEREARIRRMQQSMRENDGKAGKEFKRVNERSAER